MLSVRCVPHSWENSGLGLQKTHCYWRRWAQPLPAHLPGGGVNDVRTTASLGGPKMPHRTWGRWEVAKISWPCVRPAAFHPCPSPRHALRPPVSCVPGGGLHPAARAASGGTWGEGRGPWTSVPAPLLLPHLAVCRMLVHGLRVAGESEAGPGSPKIPASSPTRRAAAAGEGRGRSLPARREAGGAASSSADVSPGGGGGGQGAAAGVRAGGGGARRGHIWRFRRRPGSRGPGSTVPARRRP